MKSIYTIAALLLLLFLVGCDLDDATTVSKPSKKWEIDIVEVQRRESVPRQGKLMYPKGDSWLVIYMDIENVSSTKENLESDDFELIVDLQSIEVNTDATGGAGTEAGIENTVAGWLGLDFEAGAKKRQVVVFDLPNGSADKIELRVKDYEFDLGASEKMTYKADPTATATPLPTNTPEPTPTLPPTSTPTPREALGTQLMDALGSSNRDVSRISGLGVSTDTLDFPVIVVHWAINDNLTEDMIKSSTKIDITEILEVIAERGAEYEAEYGGVLVVGYFPLIDVYGNESEEKVVIALYSRETVERADWANIPLDNVYLIADEISIEPAFQD